jgi:hypothetical protein
MSRGNSNRDCLQRAAWFPLQVGFENRVFWGWWNQAGNLVRTVVAEAKPDVPTVLELASGYDGPTMALSA